MCSKCTCSTGIWRGSQGLQAHQDPGTHFLLQNVFSYYRMCSLTTERGSQDLQAHRHGELRGWKVGWEGLRRGREGRGARLVAGEGLRGGGAGGRAVGGRGESHLLDGAADLKLYVHLRF